MCRRTIVSAKGARCSKLLLLSARTGQHHCQLALEEPNALAGTFNSKSRPSRIILFHLRNLPPRLSLRRRCCAVQSGDSPVTELAFGLALMTGHPSEKGFKDGKRARCASIASRGWRWSATAACSCATTNHSVRCITSLHSGIFGTCQECQQQSLVRTGNLQLYAPQVFFVIPFGRILCRQKSCVIQSHLRSLRELCPQCSRGARGSIRTQRKMGLGVWAANYTLSIVGTCNGVSIRGCDVGLSWRQEIRRELRG